MNILILAAEVAPYAKVGGLADVAGALPKALKQLGHDVRVVMPRYQQIDTAKWGLRPSVEPWTSSVGGEQLPVSVFEGNLGGAAIFFVDVGGMFVERAAIYGEGDDGRRFLFFCAAALELPHRLDWKPDILHANDWHTAIVPALAGHGGGDPFLAGAATVFTIHNLAYQGVVERAALGGAVALLPDDVQDAWVNIMALGLRTADILTTVSPTYAQEILTPEYGAGLEWLLQARRDRLFGVLNGIDVEVFNPETDEALGANYSLDNLQGKAACKAALQREAGFAEDPAVPLLGMVGRLVDQKGFDLFAAASESILNETPLQVVILGTGQPEYHALLQRLEQQYPGRIRAWLAFDAMLAERIYAGADMFLMPSRFEPCGLGQMIAMRYGTVPIVRGTGGLVDTVQEGPPSDPRTGFVFWRYDPGDLQDAIRRAIAAYNRHEEWQQIVRHDMQVDNSWTRSAQAYVDLYRMALGDA
jgi:starch synthase